MHNFSRSGTRTSQRGRWWRWLAMIWRARMTSWRGRRPWRTWSTDTAGNWVCRSSKSNVRQGQGQLLEFSFKQVGIANSGVWAPQRMGKSPRRLIIIAIFYLQIIHDRSVGVGRNGVETARISWVWICIGDCCYSRIFNEHGYRWT